MDADRGVRLGQNGSLTDRSSRDSARLTNGAAPEIMGTLSHSLAISRQIQVICTLDHVFHSSPRVNRGKDVWSNSLKQKNYGGHPCVDPWSSVARQQRSVCRAAAPTRDPGASSPIILTSAQSLTAASARHLCHATTTRSRGRNNLPFRATSVSNHVLKQELVINLVFHLQPASSSMSDLREIAGSSEEQSLTTGRAWEECKLQRKRISHVLSFSERPMPRGSCEK